MLSDLLTCVVLLASSVEIDPGTAQALRERDESTSMLTRALELVPAPLDADDKSQEQPAWWVAERRACEGCPRRSVGRALFQTTMINVFYEAANLIRGQVTAKITPKTWWDNMEQGWVWDLDDFAVNQIGHPVPGEQLLHVRPRQRPELLRVGGVDRVRQRHLGVFRRDEPAVGERLHQHDARRHRARRDVPPRRLARARHPGHRAWAAVARDRRDRPGSGDGLQPLSHGGRHAPDRQACRHGAVDARRVRVGGRAVARVSRPARSTSTGQPFLEMDLLYGDPRTGHSRTPYDAFAVRLRFGGGSAFSEARVRGRLLGQPLGRRQDAVHRPAELRLSEQRRLCHRSAVVRGGGRRDAAAVVADQMSGSWDGEA